MSCSLYTALERQGVLHTGHSPLPLPFGTQHFPSELKVGRVDVRVQRDVSHPLCSAFPSAFSHPRSVPRTTRLRALDPSNHVQDRASSGSTATIGRSPSPAPVDFEQCSSKGAAVKIRGWTRQGQCKIAGRGLRQCGGVVVDPRQGFGDVQRVVPPSR
jgi:hypothetical protein